MSFHNTPPGCCPLGVFSPGKILLLMTGDAALAGKGDVKWLVLAGQNSGGVGCKEGKGRVKGDCALFQHVFLPAANSMSALRESTVSDHARVMFWQHFCRPPPKQAFF